MDTRANGTNWAIRVDMTQLAVLRACYLCCFEALQVSLPLVNSTRSGECGCPGIFLLRLLPALTTLTSQTATLRRSPWSLLRLPRLPPRCHFPTHAMFRCNDVAVVTPLQIQIRCLLRLGLKTRWEIDRRHVARLQHQEVMVSKVSFRDQNS